MPLLLLFRSLLSSLPVLCAFTAPQSSSSRSPRAQRFSSLLDDVLFLAQRTLHISLACVHNRKSCKCCRYIFNCILESVFRCFHSLRRPINRVQLHSHTHTAAHLTQPTKLEKLHFVRVRSHVCVCAECSRNAIYSY